MYVRYRATPAARWCSGTCSDSGRSSGWPVAACSLTCAPPRSRSSTPASPPTGSGSWRTWRGATTAQHRTRTTCEKEEGEETDDGYGDGRNKTLNESIKNHLFHLIIQFVHSTGDVRFFFCNDVVGQNQKISWIHELSQNWDAFMLWGK